MIIDIPTSSSFENVANILLHSAWKNLVKLIKNYEDFEELKKYEPEMIDQEQLNLFWTYERPILDSSLALVQQAVEFYLKGRIVEVSPYLIIGKEPRYWPRGCNKSDFSFSEFRTIDAQDLIIVHDTVVEKKLSKEFSELYSEMRKKRNSIMHTVDSKLSVSPEELAISILSVHSEMVGKGRWIRTLISLLGSATEFQILKDGIKDSDDYVYPEVHDNFALVVTHLESSYVKEFLNFDKMADSLECHHCIGIMEQNEFYDTKWRDGHIPTVQKLEYETDRYRCAICEYEFIFDSTPCNVCDRISIRQEDGICVWCEKD